MTPINYFRWRIDSLWLFLKCLSNYDESIRGNELTIRNCWSFCHAIRSMRYEKSIPFDAIAHLEKLKNRKEVKE